MKIPIPLASLIALAMTTSGCSNAVESPAYQANPNPARRYTVLAELKDSPGPFQQVTATARYRIGPHTSCMPDAEPISGTFPTPREAVLHPQVTRLSATRYTAQVGIDGMAAKDYFGKGVCSWVFEGLSFALQATAAPGDTRFIAAIGAGDLSAGRPTVLYFKRQAYPRHAVDGVSEHGTANPDRYPGSAASQRFTVTLAAKESGHDHQQ